MAEMPPPPRPAPPWRLWAIAGTAAALLLGAGLWLRARSRLPPEAALRVDQARELLLLDDARSLEKATALFTEAARIAAGEAGPEGERAFALLLQGAAWKDLADRLQGVSAAADERDKYAAESERLLQSGLAAAKAALEEDADDPAALRALALHAAALRVPDQGALERARRNGPGDPWLALVSGLQLRDEPEKAMEALNQARRAEPRLLRADVEWAALSIDQRRPVSARKALARVLQANPEHERARRRLAVLPAR